MILSLFPGYEPCFGGPASDWSPFRSGVQSGPRLANSQMRIRDKTNTRALAATIPAPTLCNSTQPNEYHGRHRRLQLRRRCPPHRGPQALLQEGLASRCVPPPRVTTRVSIFSCKLHPPKRTVGYRLKPSGPWWSVTRGNARVVDRLADLTPPVPVPNRSQACPGGEGCVREGCRQVSRAPVEDPPTPID